MTYRLFIDDERFPTPVRGNHLAVVRSSQQAIEYVKEHGCSSFISFVHDLGEDDTAMIFVKWLVEYDMDHPGFIPDDFNYYIHSQNPIGKKNIEGYLSSYLSQRS